MNLSIRLQELRQKSKFSQEELAEKLGVSRQAISKWESEQSNPDLDNIIKLSGIYNTSTDYLLTGADSSLISNSNATIVKNQNHSSDEISSIEKAVVYGMLGIFGTPVVISGLAFLFGFSL